jgi:diguanylate cyclase (GGDEF)-like protein
LKHPLRKLEKKYSPRSIQTFSVSDTLHMTEVDSPAPVHHGIDCELERTLTLLEQAQDKLVIQASRDLLTGLPNRRAMERQLASRVRRAEPFTAIYIDLNGFKKINDIHGHAAGDELLRQVGARLRTVLGADHTIGRWGGDEFVAFVEGGTAEARALAARVRGSFGKPFAIESVRPNTLLGAAVGMAVWTPNDTAAELLRRADFAMYEQKGRRKRHCART